MRWQFLPIYVFGGMMILIMFLAALSANDFGCVKGGVDVVCPNHTEKN